MSKINLKNKLQQASNYYKNGDFEKANEVLNEVLKYFPNNKSAKNLRNKISNKKMSHIKNITNHIKKKLALEINEKDKNIVKKEILNYLVEYPDSTFLWNILGIVSFELGQNLEAEKAFQKAFKISPNSAEINNNLGRILRENKNKISAKFYFEKAIKIQPDFTEALKNLASIYVDNFEYDEAEYYFQSLLDLEPSNLEVIYEMGCIQLRLNKFSKAEKWFKKALEIAPKNIQILNNLGVSYLKQKKFKSAQEIFDQALKVSPDNIDILNNMGVIFKEENNLSAAISTFHKIIQLDKRNAQALNNLGNAYQDNLQFLEAENAYKNAIALDKRNASYLCNIANVYTSLREIKKSINCQKKALEIQSNFPEVIYNMSSNFLLQKNFSSGFELYESRWEGAKNFQKRFESKKPIWDPFLTLKKRILITSEQGVGDEIMFCSLLPDVYKTNNEFEVLVDPRLLSLCRRSFPAEVSFTSKFRPIDDLKFDYHIPIGSLPLHFRKLEREFLQSQSQYLFPDTLKSEKIRRNLIENEVDILCGVSWSGGSTRKDRKFKAIELSKIVNSLKDFNIKFVNLQYGDFRKEILDLEVETGIKLWSVAEIDTFNDIDGLAALISACDVIVTVDNLTVHLAGSLGVKTYLLLSNMHDWRWALTDTTSYWHKSVNILRQKKLFDWSYPLGQLSQAFDEASSG